ncbi:MAG: Far upstream element-binding protein 3, partial [Paramarteilia canceri]
VQFDKDEPNVPSGEKTCIIVGTNEAVETAESKVIEIINTSVQMNLDSGIPTMGKEVRTEFPIPFDKIGMVIGKNGMTIREINISCGATAQISEDPPDENGLKKFIIQGGVENVKMCIHKLCEKAEI